MFIIINTNDDFIFYAKLCGTTKDIYRKLMMDLCDNPAGCRGL
jgi:hypothetical protein